MCDKLINLQKDLKICTSNITPATLNSWFDTKCEFTLDFLDWFTNSISNENIPTNSDTEVFEHLQNEGLALSKEQCCLNLAELESQYPSINEIVENAKETNVLRSELINLETAQRSLKTFHSRYKSLNEDLKFLNNQQVTKFAEEEAKENCLVLARKFDDLNLLLQKEMSISVGSEQSAYKHVNSSKTILNEHFNEIKILGNEAITQINNIKSNQLDISSKQLGKCNFPPNKFSVMNRRITSCLPQLHITRAKRVAMEAKLKFLDDFEDNSFISNNEIRMDNDEKAKITDDIYNVVKNVTENYANFRQISNIENLLILNNNEYEHLQKFKQIVEECLSFYTLITMVCQLETEKLDIKREFIQNYKECINNYFRTSKECFAILNDLSLEWEEYKNIPFGKNKFFEILAGVIVGTSDTENIFSQVNNFNMEIKALENKYSGTSEEDIKTVNIIKNDIKQMTKFLQGGPTTNHVIVPFKINQLLYNINEEIVWEKKEMLKIKMLYLDYSKLIKSNWSKIRFQLWVYFLMDKGKLKTLISNLEQEVNSR